MHLSAANFSFEVPLKETGWPDLTRSGQPQRKVSEYLRSKYQSKLVGPTRPASPAGWSPPGIHTEQGGGPGAGKKLLAGKKPPPFDVFGGVFGSPRGPEVFLFEILLIFRSHKHQYPKF